MCLSRFRVVSSSPVPSSKKNQKQQHTEAPRAIHAREDTARKEHESCIQLARSTGHEPEWWTMEVILESTRIHKLNRTSQARLDLIEERLLIGCSEAYELRSIFLVSQQDMDPMYTYICIHI